MDLGRVPKQVSCLPSSPLLVRDGERAFVEPEVFSPDNRWFLGSGDFVVVGITTHFTLLEAGILGQFDHCCIVFEYCIHCCS